MMGSFDFAISCPFELERTLLECCACSIFFTRSTLRLSHELTSKTVARLLWITQSSPPPRVLLLRALTS